MSKFSFFKVSYFCVMAIAFLLLAGYSHNLQQRNPESLFLSERNQLAFKNFQTMVKDEPLILIKTTISNIDEFYSKLEPLLEGLRFLGPKDIPRGSEIVSLHGEEYSGAVIFLPLGQDHSLLFEKLKTDLGAKIIGSPYTNFLLDKYSRDIQEFLFPLLFALSFLFLIFMTRSLGQALLVFFPALFSAILGLTGIKSFYHTMNLVTSIIPLMLFILSLSIILHLIFSLQVYDSMRKALHAKGLPIGLMILTTSIGFGSLGLSEIPVISQFGKLCSFLIFITGLINMSWILACGTLIKIDISGLSRFPFRQSLSRKIILILGGGVLLLGLWGGSQVNTLTDGTKYFPAVEGYREDIQDISQTMMGIPLLEILLEKKDGFSYEDFYQISKIERNFQSNHSHYQILSLNSLVLDINKQYTGDDEFPLKFSFFPLVSRVPPLLKSAYPLGESYRLTLLGPPIDADDYFVLINQLKQGFQSLSFEGKQHFNGLYFSLMKMQETMLRVLATSFSLSLILILIITFIIYRKLKFVFVMLVANLLPFFATLFCQWLFGLSYNIATIMTYSLGVGVLVDNSFHLIHVLKDPELTMEKFKNCTLAPMLWGGLLLIFSFSLLIFQGFIPISQFGSILVLLVFFGLLCDLYILPTLILGGHKIEDYLQKQ